MKTNYCEKIGYTIAVLGTATILIWIGLFKFTETEAKAIENLVANHPMMNIFYSFFSIQETSIIIGIMEIITALGLILSFWSKKAGVIAGTLTTLTFLTTLSFVYTTPNTWKFVDDFFVTNFFILKDLPIFGIGLIVLGKSLNKSKNSNRRGVY